MTTRDEFEKYAISKGADIGRMEFILANEIYKEGITQAAWESWQAATYAAELKYKPLVEALQWYASLENYKSPQTLAFHHFNHAENPALMDKGKRALEALKSLQSVGGESV